MRKALVIAILALFGSETLAQHGFRPLTRPGNPPPFHPTSGKNVLLDSEDNEMFRLERPIGGTPPFNPNGPLINRPILTNQFDETEDNEMFRVERPIGGTPPFNPYGTPPFNPQGPLINRPTMPRINFDETEDNEMFRVERPIGGTPPFNPNGPLINRPTIPRTNFDDVEDNEMALDLRLPKEPVYRVRFAEDDDEFFGVPMGNGGSGLYASGGSARGGVAWGGVGQYSHPVSKNVNVFAGAQVSHAPGSKVNIAPHAGVQIRFDDAENDEFFVGAPQDDELFGVPMGNGGSGLYASGGSARGGVAWGAVGQYSHQVAKNTNVFAGAQVSHAPGSKMNIAPHVGVQVRFDDEDNELFAEVPQDDELYAEDDEYFGVPMGNGGSGLYASGGSARGGVAWGGVGQYSHPVAKNTNVFVGAQVSHAPGSKVNIAPHAGVQFRFDDEQN